MDETQADQPRPVAIVDFFVWLLLSFVTLGIYSAWWWFSRLETAYRAAKP